MLTTGDEPQPRARPCSSGLLNSHQMPCKCEGWDSTLRKTRPPQGASRRHRGTMGEPLAHGAQHNHKNKQARAGPGRTEGRRSESPWPRALETSAHLPQRHRRAASRTSAVPGALWGEVQACEPHLLCLRPGAGKL